MALVCALDARLVIEQHSKAYAVQHITAHFVASGGVKFHTNYFEDYKRLRIYTRMIACCSNTHFYFFLELYVLYVKYPRTGTQLLFTTELELSGRNTGSSLRFGLP